MNKEILVFIDKYIKEIKEESAAVFLGAGFSKKSGFVDWKSLLKGIADELDLDIKKEESNLVSLAQYYCNKNRSRYEIDRLIFEEFNKDVEISENHRILARLPIFTYWTTNYDSLIEDAMKEIKKIPDIKYNSKQLSQTKLRRDAIVYKMHGDKEHPSDTVIIKEDYELYYRKYAPFITALNGDLISKTFLFIGFNFTDPNLDYILSRIKIEYGPENQRTHYAIVKEVSRDNLDDAEYEYQLRKQKLFIEDLKRYNIQALKIDSYDEITKVLRTIEKFIIQNNIFISGSAHSYGDWSEDDAKIFIHNLTKVLIQKGFNIVSGFGLGVGSYVITGALEEIYINSGNINDERLLLRPFPQGIVNEQTRAQIWSKYRKDMISRAGISIFMFGNKLDEHGNMINAGGVISEFEIASGLSNLLIPVGCTGYAASQIWTEVKKNYDYYYGNSSAGLKELFEKLNVLPANKENLIETVIEFISEAKSCMLKQ